MTYFEQGNALARLFVLTEGTPYFAVVEGLAARWAAYLPLTEKGEQVMKELEETCQQTTNSATE